MKIFKPMLAPNEKPDLSKISYPIFASLKMDGIRCIFKNGKMLSRSLKEIPNKQLQDKFQFLKDYTAKHNIIFDGEIYGENLAFQEVTHWVMSEDLENEIMPQQLKFYCFDMLDLIDDEVEGINMEFYQRVANLKALSQKGYILNSNDIVIVNQTEVNSKEEVEEMFNEALERFYEGLILKAISSKYKFGRATLNSGDMYKCKLFLTIDGKIISVEERFENTAQSFKNELGRTVRHNFKDEKQSTGIAACFVVDYEDQEQRVMITGDEAFRREIWKNKKDYIGKCIEYKGMIIGSKDLIRHPTFLRFRSDK